MTTQTLSKEASQKARLAELAPDFKGLLLSSSHVPILPIPGCEQFGQVYVSGGVDDLEYSFRPDTQFSTNRIYAAEWRGEMCFQVGVIGFASYSEHRTMGQLAADKTLGLGGWSKGATYYVNPWNWLGVVAFARTNGRRLTQEAWELLVEAARGL